MSTAPTRDPARPRTTRASLISRHGSFHDLRVRAVEPLTDDAVAVTLDVPEQLRADYRYQPGQHLTIRHQIDGVEARRSYSICLAPPVGDQGPETLRVAVKRLGPGGFGTYARDELAAGDMLSVMVPAGRFRLRAEQPGGHHVAIAAGSGITPVLAIVTAALRDDPEARVSLLYGNRSTASVMFLDELADLKDRYPSRFTVLHVLSREPRDAPLLSGRLDADRISTLLDAVGARPGDATTQYYLCGPLEMVTTARELLAERAAPGHVHFELFDTGTPLPKAAPRQDAASDGPGGTGGPGGPDVTRLDVTLHGRRTEATMTAADDSVLAAVLRARPEAPYSCTGGVCGTCRALLRSGEVRMAADYALEPEEKADRFILACQSTPLSDALELDFDA
jgi:ring-1,2-phenylacetyl-CoA epoxidase subunit PaaE